jgi:hypothetical protein
MKTAALKFRPARPDAGPGGPFNHRCVLTHFPGRTCLFLLLMLGGLGVAAADDVTDAKIAFATLQTWQKTDDPRSLDLFATNCTVLITVAGAGQPKTVFVPPAAFRENLTHLIALKQGNHDSYDDVTCSADGFSVKLSATIYHPETGRHGLFSVVYERDHDGVLKIYELKVNMFAHATNAPAAKP